MKLKFFDLNKSFVMQRPHRIRRMVFESYAPICAGGFIISTFLFSIRCLDWSRFAAIAAGIFAFAFGVQKQSLEEIKLFKELFEQFNKRYDKMNDDMNHIYGDSKSPLTEAETKTLFKYFNLCGEEYLYFQKGFICVEVWQAWNNGMKFFRQNPRIKKLWDDELGTGSYYGLKF